MSPLFSWVFCPNNCDKEPPKTLPLDYVKWKDGSLWSISTVPNYNQLISADRVFWWKKSMGPSLICPVAKWDFGDPTGPGVRWDAPGGKPFTGKLEDHYYVRFLRIK